jgi:hypothetical protein
VIDDLQQQVAELLLEGGHVGTLDGVGDLIGFLDGVRRDRLEGLVDVPRAAVPAVAEPCHDRQQPGQRLLGQAFGRGLSSAHYRIIYIMTNMDCLRKHNILPIHAQILL